MTVTIWGSRENRPWSTEELDQFPEDGIRRELVDGLLIQSPAPSALHQKVATLLMVWLDSHCPPELSAVCGVGMRISSTTTLIPDGVVTTATSMAANAAHFKPEDVRLAVEVVSPHSISIDRVLKPALYAAAGIPSYWRVELDGSIVVHTHTLDPVAQVYRETGIFDTTVAVDLPWQMRLPIAEIAPKHPVEGMTWPMRIATEAV